MGTADAGSQGASEQTALNIRLLRVITTAEEGGAMPEEPEARSRVRLEAKVDLLLAFLARDEAADVPRREVALHPGGVYLYTEGATNPGTRWRLSLWLSEAIPWPFVVEAATTDEVDESGRTLLHFEGLTEEESDLLERFIFQQHRRAVAAARRGRDGVD